jgi:hypothetical protein
MSSMNLTFCRDVKPIKDLAAVAAKVGAPKPVDPFTFPEWSYTQTEKYTGKITTFTTRARWINGKYWSDADINYYEKLKAAQQQYDMDAVQLAIMESEAMAVTQ